MVHTVSHPGESSATFMPMINLKVNDEISIFSTMHFIVGQAKNTMLTLYQLLISHYTKKRMKYQKESENSELKRIVLRLVGIYTFMNFLGSIGHFMSSSGLCEVLETIYGSDTVPHNALRFSHLKGISGSPYCFRSALCNNNF